MSLTKVHNRLIAGAKASVIDFGADPTGVSDSTQAIKDAIASAKSIFFPAGLYKVTETITVGTQRVLTGVQPSGIYNTSLANGSRIFASTADLGDGNPIFTVVADGDSGQDVIFENLQFKGDTSYDFSDLQGTMSTTGIIGLNVRGVKQGCQFLNCSFRELKTAVTDQIGSGGYLDKVTFSDCMFIGHNLALNLTPTAGLSLTNCYFDECLDWIDGSSELVMTQCRFNNSSFAGIACQIEATSIVGDGVYVEGGNRWFRPTKYASLRGCHFSEAFSSSGSDKYVAQSEANDVMFEFRGCRLPTNTRLIAFDNHPVTYAYNRTTVEVVGCYGGDNFGNNSDINYYITRGLKYLGYGNSVSNDLWNRNEIGVSTLSGVHTEDGDGNTNIFPIRNRMVYFTTSINFTIDISTELSYDWSFSDWNFTMCEFTVVGCDDTAGGANAFFTKLYVYKGFADVWDYHLDGPDSASYGVVLSSNTSGGVTVTLSETHAGIREILILNSATENVKITF